MIRGVLISVGIVLIVLASAAWVAPDFDGTRGPKVTETVTKEGTKSTKVTETDPGAASLRSEALAGGLLGAGALLVLTGALFGRITSISLLGGKLDLAPEAQAKLVSELAPRTNDPDKARNAYLEALVQLEAEGWRRHARPPDDHLEEVAAAAQEKVGT